MTRRPATTGGNLPPPESEPGSWPPPEVPPAQSSARRSGRWSSWAALLAGAFGMIGAMLPAMDGQKIGDPESTAYRIGAPLGFVGGLLAIALGLICTSRSTVSTSTRTVAIGAIVVGGAALFLTAALVFSG